MKSLIYKTCIFNIICLVSLMGCAANTDIEPTIEGNIGYNMSIGGPIISALGIKFPTPYLIIGGSYGYREDITLSANLHLLSLIYGVAGVEFGAKKYFRVNDDISPLIGVGANFLMLASVRSRSDDKMRIYPYLSATSTWKKERSAYYLGVNLAIPISSMDYYDKFPSAILSPSFGYRRDIGASTRITVELRFNAVNHKTDQLSVEYLNIGGNGAITPLFAIERGF